MKANVTWRKSALAVLVMGVLTGCDGSDGTDAQPNIEMAQSVAQLNLAVTEIEQVNGATQVTVLATNEGDDIVAGLKELELKQYQLYPMGHVNSGDSAYWQSNGSFDQFTNNGDGTYTFILTDHNPDTSLTQRYNLISPAGTLADGISTVPHQEISVDFSGTGGPARYTKNVVAQQACEQCHSPTAPISQRHSGFYELETCISCHSETKLPGKHSSFQHLIHTVHNANGHSFTDKYGNEYNGETASGLVKDNCQVCHQANDELTEWGNWSRVPTKETCSGCHNSGYDPDTKAIIHLSHLADQEDNSGCASCHGAGEIERIHSQGSEQADADAVINMLSSQMSAEAQANGDVIVTITLLNADGQAVDANDYQKHINWVELIANVNPNAGQLNYSTKKTANYTVSAQRWGSENPVTFEQDGTLKATFSGLLVDDFASETAHILAGIRYFAKDGELATVDDHNALTTGKGSAAEAAISATAKQRHDDSIDASRCASCHGANLQVHNGQYSAGFLLNDELQIGDCAVCHNPEGVYSEYTPVKNGALETLVHVTHSNPSFGGNCAACHTSFNLDSFADKGAIHWYTNETDYFATPFAATCSSCHDSDAARNHMKQSGNAAFDADKLMVESTVESCAMCHDADAIAEHHSVQF